MVRRNWLVPAILLFSTTLAATPSSAQEQQKAAVTVAKPVVRDVVDRDDFIGRFEAVDEVTIRSRIGGYLDQVEFTDGAMVKKGDQLFVIDQRPYQTALDVATSSLEVAKSTLVFAEAEFTRTENLVQKGTLPVSTLDDRRRELRSAQANLRGAEASLARATLDMEYTKIVAPLAGRIDRRLISVGNLVQADQTALTTIVSLDPIDFYFDVDERRVLNYARQAREQGRDLQEGGAMLDVYVTIADSTEKPFKGKLDFAENRVDQETGTMRVRARFDNPNFVLQPGLFGRVEVSASNTYKGILIPDDAIGSDQDQRVVYVVAEDGSFTTRPVRLGPRLYGYRVIREGMTGDETIVVNGLTRLRPGVIVDPKMITLPPEAAATENGQ